MRRLHRLNKEAEFSIIFPVTSVLANLLLSGDFSSSSEHNNVSFSSAILR